jgi:hypothetical protein
LPFTESKDIVLKFLGKLGMLVALVGILDFGIGSLLEYLFFHQGNNWYAATTYALNESEEDILIFGSSRAIHHYIPEILTEKTGLSCYNAGCDGQSLFYDYALFKSILVRRTPEKVILDLSKFSLYFDQFHYDRLSHLYPYYRDNAELRKVIDLKDRSGRYVRLSKLYTFNSTILVILKSFVSPRTDYNGYIPYPTDHRMDSSEISYEPLGIDMYIGYMAEERLDEQKINILNQFVDDALEAGIDLYIMESPYFFLQKDTDNASLAKIRDILEEKHIRYYNFSNDKIFSLNPGLFGDGIHLNPAGAEIYSQLVGDIIAGEHPE